MEHVKQLLETVTRNLSRVSAANAVVARPVSVGDRHVVPLVELVFGMGAGGGIGEGDEPGKGQGSGEGGGGGGGVKASPVAVLVIEGDQVRLEKIGN